jgi:hypothetical protein
MIGVESIMSYASDDLIFDTLSAWKLFKPVNHRGREIGGVFSARKHSRGSIK